MSNLAAIDDFLNIECELVATNGPFASSPLSSEISADGANRLQPQWQNMRRGRLEFPPPRSIGELWNSMRHLPRKRFYLPLAWPDVLLKIIRSNGPRGDPLSPAQNGP